jgi:hypothetical protein
VSWPQEVKDGAYLTFPNWLTYTPILSNIMYFSYLNPTTNTEKCQIATHDGYHVSAKKKGST